MAQGSSSTISAWLPPEGLPETFPLEIDTDTGVCVVGGGIAGVTTAYLLALGGERVVLLESDRIGSGETGRTTAHLSNAIDDRYTEVERIRGTEGARLAASSHTYAIDTIEEIVTREKIDCDFLRVDGYLFPAAEHGSDLIEAEAAAARRAGLVGVEVMASPPLPRLGKGPVLRFPRQGQFHPLKYLTGLTAAFRKAGGVVFTGTHVTQVEPGKSATAPIAVRTRGKNVVRARAVVLATNSPIAGSVTLHTKQAPYRTYVVALRAPRGTVPAALYWDTLDPYHYVRIQPGAPDPSSDLVIVGGEDHKTGHVSETEERFARLIGWARTHFPDVEDEVYAWSGQVMETLDGVGYIGASPGGPPNLYIATGDSGMGMTHGTIAGLLLSDLVSGRPNPWAELYDPSRKPIRAAMEWAKENLDVALQYTDHLHTPHEVTDIARIAPGQGAVLRRGAQHIAAYRDPDGNLHERSAVCTHLGCVVHWNGTERSWDCPCHGSRFAPLGDVLNGPASKPLAAATPEGKTLSERDPEHERGE